MQRAFEQLGGDWLIAVLLGLRVAALCEVCDRCGESEAITTVRCAYGCAHRQCEDCAEVTRCEVM